MKNQRRRALVPALFAVCCFGVSLVESAEPLQSIPKLSTPVVNITNENVASFKNINDIFAALRFDGTGCNGEKEDVWARILQDKAIQPCKFDVEIPWERPNAERKAGSSGILTETKKGNRYLKSTPWNDCSGQEYKLNFTYDVVETPAGNICGFEVFIKKPNGEIFGFATASNGAVLKTVPEQLAFDKYNSKEGTQTSKTITSGAGCMECHPRVSIDFGTGNRWFWGEKVIPRKTAARDQKSPPAPTHSNQKKN